MLPERCYYCGSYVNADNGIVVMIKIHNEDTTKKPIHKEKSIVLFHRGCDDKYQAMLEEKFDGECYSRPYDKNIDGV